MRGRCRKGIGKEGIWGKKKGWGKDRRFKTKGNAHSMVIGSHLSCSNRSVFIDSLVSCMINLKSQRSKEISLFQVNLTYHFLFLCKNVFSSENSTKDYLSGYSLASKQRPLAERERGTLARSRLICSSRNVTEKYQEICITVKFLPHNCIKMSTFIKEN